MNDKENMAKSKSKKIEECTTLFEIEVPPEIIAKAFEEVYEEIAKIANIPGFRVGKAPKDMVIKHYAKDAKEEVLKRLVPEAYRSAVEEHEIRPIGLPEISDVNFEEAKLLSFKAKVNTRPVFKLRDYKGLKVAKKKVTIKDEDVEKTIDNLRGMHAKYLTVEDRPVSMGDYVVSDMDCFVDGKPIHKKRENLWLYADKDSLVPGLSDGLVGMKKGEEKDIEVTLPEKYPDKAVAGKRAKYHVYAKEIKERQLPKVDDELAKLFGRQNLEDLKKEISKELSSRAAMDADIAVENQLLGKITDDNVFEVPSSLVARQLDFMVEDTKKHLLEKGFKKEDLDKQDEEFKKKFKDEAVRRVRLLFILDDIADKENIETTDDDVKEAYKSISAQTGQPEDTVKNYYEKEDMVESLKDKVRESKVIQFLLKNAQITEA